MLFYPDGTAVSFVVAFQTKEGEPIVPTQITAVLRDGEDLVLADLGQLVFDAPSGQISITILGQLNTLAEDETRAVRVLDVVMQTLSGPVRQSISYVIEVEQTVAVMVNSFQGLAAAELLGLDMPQATGWQIADEARRRSALVEAYKRICVVPLKYALRDAEGKATDDENYIDRDIWLEISAEDFRTFPSAFRRALQRAQVLEADDILQGDSVNAKRRAGIITEVISQSSVTLAQNRLDMGISTAALNALAGYVHYDIRVRRA